MGERAVGWMKEKTERVLGTEEKARLYKCSETIGMDIQNTAGEKIAQLSDIVFDVREGSIVYGLASYGGLLGIGGQTAAVPFSAITLEHQQGIAKLDADRSTLDSAIIPRGDLHKLNEPMFARQIHTNFAQEPYWEVLGYVPPTAEGVTVAVAKDAWLPDSDYNKSYKLDTVTTIEGTVKSVGTFTPERDAAAGLELKIETMDGDTLTIQAGPQSHYLAQDIRFNEGDRITVIGSKTRPGLSLKSVIMASEIKKGDDTLRLRDERGTPLWKVEMPEKPRDTKMKPEKESGTY
jgi:sporulation protein YlmC with PRC-barrel domain